MMQEKYAFVCVLKNPASGPDGHDMFKTQGFGVFKAVLPRTGMEIEFTIGNARSRMWLQRTLVMNIMERRNFATRVPSTSVSARVELECIIKAIY